MEKSPPAPSSTEPKSDSLLEFILSHMAQGIIYVDHGERVTVFNQAAEKMLGKQAEEVLGKKVSETFSEEIFGFSIRNALNGEKIPRSCNISYLKENERVKEEILEIEPTQVIEKNSRQAFGLIILIRNVTEIRRLENIADRKNRLQDLGEMASTIGHEIRNPLGGIKGFASLLVKDLENQQKLKSMADNIVKGTDDLNNILTQLLDYSHPKPLQIEEADIVQTIYSVIDQIRADKSVPKGIKILYQGSETPASAEIDIPHFKAVLLNLLLNAVEALKDSGTITVKLTETEKEIRVYVIDDGPGIPENIQKKIFRPFFSTKLKGSGFGLAESRRIADSHNGSLDVQSEQGKGAAFRLTIPRKHED